MWTEEQIHAIALKYRTQKDWRYSDRNSLAAAERRGNDLLRRVTSHMDRLVTYRSNEDLLVIASRYQHRCDWRDDDFNSMMAARKRGKEFYAKCTEHMAHKKRNQIRTDQELMDAIAKHPTKSDLRKNSPNLYEDARKRGKEFYSLATKHMRALKILKYTDDELLLIALKYRIKSDWGRDHCGSYAAASRRGKSFFDKATAHMEVAGGTDNDAIYIWKAEGESYNSTPVYKIGVTSERLGVQRIKECADRSGMTPTLIILRAVKLASVLECKLLKLGNNPGYTEIEGFTEFRSLTGIELMTAKSMIANYSAC